VQALDTKVLRPTDWGLAPTRSHNGNAAVVELVFLTGLAPGHYDRNPSYGGAIDRPPSIDIEFRQGVPSSVPRLPRVTHGKTFAL